MAKRMTTGKRAEPAGAKAASERLLAEGKGREVLGVLMAAMGLLLLASLISYHPLDESLLQSADGEERRNWIGPVGAQLAALLLGLFGLASFLLAAGLVWAGARRMRRAPGAPVVGRGFGIVLSLIVLPPLLQVVLGRLSWRGEPLDPGGVIGLVLGGGLEDRLGWLGALLVLLAGLLAGIALVVQSSLEDITRSFLQRFSERFGQARMAVERRRERRERERSRQRVLDKHVERAERLRRPAVKDSGASPSPAPASEPLRVVERSGPGRFSFQKVTGAPPRPASGPSEFEPLAEVPRTRDGAPTPATKKPPTPMRPAPARKRTPVPKTETPPQPALFEKSSDPYALPPINLLSLEKVEQPIAEDDLVQMGEAIRARCAEFGVQGTVEMITPGPVITVFEFQPAPGVKVSQIVNLSDDLALALRAESIRIDRIPGKSTLGIEVPNADRAIIQLGPLIASKEFQKNQSPLTMALGSTLHGEYYYGDLAKMPHLLVAGATGAGKSVGLQSMITSILYKANRDEVKFIFIDPKRIELGVYSDIPHLKTEVVVEPKKAANALRWAVSEMERRYKLLAEVHVRSIDFYNRAILDPEVQKRLSLRDEDDETEVDLSDLRPLPYLVVIIDELADLMMVSSSEVEQSIARLAQMARAVGIHLIVATQRPSVDVLTGTIKANFPCRMSFATATRHDSRTILDQVGAEKLLGKGDMLFLPPGSARPIRLHGAYVSEQETAGLIRWLKRLGAPELDLSVVKAPKEETSSGGGAGDDLDPLFDDAARLVVSEGMGSASFLQRRMRVGFSRAARLIDMLADDGILGPPQGSKPREVLVPANYFEEVDATKGE